MHLTGYLRKECSMAEARSRASTSNSKFIRAPREVVFRAFSDPAALAAWLAPGDMTGEVHQFDFRVGAGYEMSLYYPATEKDARGKTSAREDRYTARYLEISPPARIVEAITFDAVDPGFAGEMIIEISLQAEGDGTNVTFVFKNIPPGIRPEDNELGTRLTLEKLAKYVE
jgi:uncharacterized protein YndB with AHSA1/START domain